jgi:hypothetical protein
MGLNVRVAQSLLLAYLFCGINVTALGEEGGSNAIIVSSGHEILDAHVVNGASSLTVAAGATAVINFGHSDTINISGDILNSGSIYAVSSNPAIGTVNFNAINIANYNGALLTTNLPTGAIFPIAGLVQNLNLSLNAVNAIFNAGNIASAGNLAMTAGTSITNTGAMGAVQTINMVTGVDGLINSGVLNSIAGSINISTLASRDLLINNTVGTLQALMGTVNVSTLASTSLDKLNLSLTGGDVLARELNVRTQEGIASIDVRDLTGVLNVSAGELHVSSNTSNLQLGAMNITGDPTFFNPGGDIQINSSLSFPGNHLAIIAGNNIYTTANNISIATNNSTFNGGSVLMVAGANIGTAGGTGNTINPASNTSTAVTLNTVPAGSAGGYIDLTGGGSNNITGIDTTGGSSGGIDYAGGSVTLVAYAGTAAQSGTITLPTNSTIQTGTTGTINGNVLVIAGATSGNAITLGTINTSGATNNAVINNGIVNIFSATPQFFQGPSSTSLTMVNMQAYAGQTFIVVNDATGIAAGQYTLNSTGANAEVVTVASVTGNTVTLSSPLQFSHFTSENILTSANSLLTFSNPLAPSVFQNNGAYGPGALQNGNITTGAITAGANIVMATNGAVNLTGSVSLTQNPSTPLATYNNTPVLQVTANQINVSAGAIVSSAINGCSFCQDQLNFFTQNIVNAGTVSGTFVNIDNPAASLLTVSNTGTISGINPGTTAGNPWVNIQSGGAITFTGNGTVAVPSWGVITVSAGDNNAINFSTTTNLNAGHGGLVSLSAQRAGGSVNIAANSALVSNPSTTGFGGPFISISTPNLNFGAGSSIQVAQSGLILTSGALVQSPQPLTITVASGTAQIVSFSTGKVVLRPSDGQNIHFTATTPGASLVFQGAPVYLFTGTSRTTATAGQVIIDSSITVTAPLSFTAVDPNGGITGIAFQPYVGLATNFSSNPKQYTLFADYTYPQVLLLMAPIAQTGQFQNLATYTQGAEIAFGATDLTLKSSYVIVDSARFTIQAAKQMGFHVTAGAYVQNPDKSVNVTPTEVEIDYAMQQAVKYGNVMDMVIGNECIVGGTDPAPSTKSLIQAIYYAQNLRNTTTSLTATTLPITTRQTYGVLSGALTYQSTVDLLNGCASCQTTYGLPVGATFEGTNGHVYADVYPYYDGTNGDGTTAAGSIANYLVPNGTSSTSRTAISQTDFQTLVTAAGTLSAPPTSPPAPPPVVVGIQADLNGTISAFKSALGGVAITPQLWVAETGWATASTESNNTQTSSLPNNAPQATPQWAGWYYPDMQGWSHNNKSSNELGYQIPINGFFEAYDEPWKFSTATWQGGEPNFGIWTASGTTSTNSTNPASASQQYQLTGIVQKYNLPIFNLQTGPLSAPPSPTSMSGPPLPTLTSSNTNFLGAFNFAVTSALNNANSASSFDGRGTIIPTDINPEVRNTTQQTNSPALEDNSSLGFNAVQNNLLGSFAPLNSTQFLLNPPSSHFTFATNSTLLAPDHNLTINANIAQVEVDAGASVMLLQTDSELAILSLHDDHGNSVRVTVDGQTLSVPVGRQVVLSRNGTKEFDDLNPSKLGYRNLAGGKLGKWKAFSSEFSMLTLLSTTPQLRQLMKSQHKDERELGRKLMKTAAAMLVINKDKSPFKASH